MEAPTAKASSPWRLPENTFRCSWSITHQSPAHQAAQQHLLSGLTIMCLLTRLDWGVYKCFRISEQKNWSSVTFTISLKSGTYRMCRTFDFACVVNAAPQWYIQNYKILILGWLFDLFVLLDFHWKEYKHFFCQMKKEMQGYRRLSTMKCTGCRGSPLLSLNNGGATGRWCEDNHASLISILQWTKLYSRCVYQMVWLELIPQSSH